MLKLLIFYDVIKVGLNEIKHIHLWRKLCGKVEIKIKILTCF